MTSAWGFINSLSKWTKLFRKKLAAMLAEVANVATVNCFEGVTRDELCTILKRTQGVAYYPPKNMTVDNGKVRTFNVFFAEHNFFNFSGSNYYTKTVFMNIRLTVT